MMRDKLATFFAYSLMAAIVIAVMATSFAVTYFMLTWAFGAR